MKWLPTNQASAVLFLHRNTLHKYRREGLFKAGTHWIRKGPWRNAGFLYDVDASKETFKILQTGVVDQQQGEPIEAIKAQLTALEGGTPNVIDV